MRRRRQQAEAARPGPTADPTCPVEQAELAAWLDAALANLPPHYRDPVVLCELQGRSRQDAARELGVPEGTLSSRLAKARRLLAEQLAEKGLPAVALGTLLGAEPAATLPTALAERTVRVLTGASVGGAAAGVVPGIRLTMRKRPVTRRRPFVTNRARTTPIARSARLPSHLSSGV